MSKILVVVPHEDDELSVAGQMLYTFAKDPQNECFVIFTTNGDDCAIPTSSTGQEEQTIYC